MKDNYIKICPRCGNTNIVQIKKEEKLLDYRNDCYYGYISGAIFPEVKESKLKEFKKQLIK